MAYEGNPDKKYDFIPMLVKAQRDECKLKEILQNKKIELKTESNKWHTSGNIVMEYASYGKPSGVAATEADYWAHELQTKDKKTLAYVIVPTGVLKTLCNELSLNKELVRRGGDNNAQEMLLLNLAEFFVKLDATNGEESSEFVPPNSAKRLKTFDC